MNLNHYISKQISITYPSDTGTDTGKWVFSILRVVIIPRDVIGSAGVSRDYLCVEPLAVSVYVHVANTAVP